MYPPPLSGTKYVKPLTWHVVFRLVFEHLCCPQSNTFAGCFPHVGYLRAHGMLQQRP